MNPVLFSAAGSARTRRRWGLLGASLLLSCVLGCSNRDEAEGRSVSLETARAAVESGQARLVDLREPQEHATGVARSAHLLPMSQLRTRLSEIPRDPAQPVLLICQTQNRSSKVMSALREQGYTNVRYVQGGMGGWAGKGWPLVPPTPR
jgi:rhodanese-related sulfurtransferase